MPSDPPTAEILDLVRSQARVETKIDLVLERLDKSDAAMEATRQRVDRLELEQAKTKGFAAAIASLVGVVTAVVVPLIKSKLGL